MSDKLNLGVIGAGWMADMACEEIVKLENIRLTAVCARHMVKAETFAGKYGIPSCYDCADDLLADPQVEAVYIATLNNTHCELAVSAMRAGKAVIVEKPFAMTVEEAEEMIRVSRETGCFLMEAMWTRFFPSLLYVKQLIRSGVVGKLKKAELHTSMKMDRTENARVFSKEAGGGVLPDIGIYALNLLQMVTGRLPVQTENRAAVSDTGVDMTDDIVYRYADGLEARVQVNGLEALPHLARFEGTEGTITMDRGLMGGTIRVETEGDMQFYDMTSERFRFPYYYQFEHFANCVKDGRKESYVMPLADSLQVMQMMEEAVSAADGAYEQS